MQGCPRDEAHDHESADIDDGIRKLHLERRPSVGLDVVHVNRADGRLGRVARDAAKNVNLAADARDGHAVTLARHVGEARPRVSVGIVRVQAVAVRRAGRVVVLVHLVRVAAAERVDGRAVSDAAVIAAGHAKRGARDPAGRGGAGKRQERNKNNRLREKKYK